MKIGGFQNVSFIDFPGRIAAVIFTQGCPWRCQYCHNPSLVRPECFDKVIPEEKIWEYLQSRRTQLDGVVVSGGEPTLHPDLPELLKKIHSLGFKIKLDTSGVFPERLQTIFETKLVSYIAMDLKAEWDKYPEVTGATVDVQAVKHSMELIRKSGIPYEWRTTVAPELPINPLEIGKYLKKGEKYFLQAFRKTETVSNPALTQSPTPSEQASMLKPLKKMGMEVAWR